MLTAEGAVLVEFQTVGGILLVLVGVVVALFALGAAQSDLNAGTCFGHGVRHLLLDSAFLGQQKTRGQPYTPIPGTTIKSMVTLQNGTVIGSLLPPYVP